MKHLVIFAMFASILAFCGSANAVRKGKPPGATGVIADVGSSGFILTDNDGKTWKVACDSNTKFMQGTEAATPDVIKSGANVTVLGGANGDQIMATTVTISKETPKKKKK